MQRVVALVLTLGMMVVFSGVALAGEMCSYNLQAGQTTGEKAETGKPVATKSTDKIDADKVVVAQTEKSNQPASEPKK
jgi:hypothetical protein